MRRAIGVATVLAVPLSLVGAASAGANPVSDENARPGDSLWQSTMAPKSSIDGYASATSVAPGDTLHLYVRAPSDRYRIEVHRLGYYGGAGGRRLLCLPNPANCASDKGPVSQPAPATPAAGTGFLDAQWNVTDDVPIDSSWVSGDYLAELILTSGPDAGKSTEVPFVVRAAPGSPSQILVTIPVNTDEAYNAWGGKSLYSFNSTGSIQANHVSFNRPYDDQTAQGTPAPAFYIDYPLVRYLESRGYDVSYETDVDVDANPSSLLSHRLVMTAGHGEYWSKGMRDAFDAARDAGVNLAFMGANTGYWQIRYEDNRRTIVAYKEKAFTDDPTTDPTQLTTRFATLNPPRPECQLEGVAYNNYDHDDGMDRAYGVSTSALTDAWMAATGFHSGDSIDWLVGYEWDRVQPGCLTPTVLFHWSAASGGDSADATRYTASSGARVFASGSLQFSWGLGGHGWGLSAYGPQVNPDARLQLFMHNGLDDLTRPAPPTSVNAALAGPNRVRLTVTRHADAQAPTVRVYRHPGSGAFSPGDSGSQVACETTGTQCDAQNVPGHSQWRFAAVVVDRWRESQVALSAPVSVPNSAPSVSLGGNPNPVSQDPDTFTAATQDPDGDAVGYTWTVDGVPQPETGPSLTRAFSQPGHHAVAVTVDDGQGGTAAATLDVDVAAPGGTGGPAPVPAAANQPPTARITGPTSFPTLRSQRFDGRASADPEGSTLGYEWRLDGRVIGLTSAANVRLTAPGPHRLELVVRDSQGAVGATAVELHAIDRSPLLVAVVPTRVPPGRLARFAARGLDPDGRLRGLTWDLPGFARSATGADLQRRLASGVRGFVRVRPFPGDAPAVLLPLRAVPGASARAVTLAGVLVPGSGPTQITIERRTCAGQRCRYGRVRRVTRRTARDGRFSLRYTAPRDGTYRFTVSAAPVPGDPRFSLTVPTRIGLLDQS